VKMFARAGGGFDPIRLKRLAEIEDWHFWFAGRRTLLSRMLRNTTIAPLGLILDVGCGTALSLAPLAAAGCYVLGIDVLADGLLRARRAHPGFALAQANGTAPLCHVLRHPHPRRTGARRRRMPPARGPTCACARRLAPLECAGHAVALESARHTGEAPATLYAQCVPCTLAGSRTAGGRHPLLPMPAAAFAGSLASAREARREMAGCGRAASRVAE